jgi:hypothetical protein
MYVALGAGHMCMKLWTEAMDDYMYLLTSKNIISRVLGLLGGLKIPRKSQIYFCTHTHVHVYMHTHRELLLRV